MSSERPSPVPPQQPKPEPASTPKADPTPARPDRRPIQGPRPTYGLLEPVELPALGRGRASGVSDPVTDAEHRTLVVGRGITLHGAVTDARRLVIEGTMEASMIYATELSVSMGGVFKGEVEVEDAEVAGTIDGTLTARGNLILRATGKVLGTARCRRLQVEDGGQITGSIEMVTTLRPRYEAEPAVSSASAAAQASAKPEIA